MAIDRNGNYMPDNFPEEVKHQYGVHKTSDEMHEEIISEMLEQMPMQSVEMPRSETGAMREKLNTVRYDYLPSLEVNEAYGRVATFGAKKYDTDNWVKGLPFSQITASLCRHVWKFMWGQTHDDDSGLHHADHILWNAVALVYFVKNKPEMDDRFPNRIEDAEKPS